jgi:hypothetical protein
MNLLAMCITWTRPQLLGRCIYSFLKQTDPNARLFVLDDAGQYHSQEHERWTLHSTDQRYPTMGEKRNALLDMAIERYPEIEGFMLFDDDDVYFPHAMECVTAALDQKCWAQPRLVLEMSAGGQSLKRTEPFRRGEQIDKSICYGGCWAWRIDTFNELGRFPVTNTGEDVKVAWPCLERFGSSADSSPGEPWYYYNRLNNSIVGEGLDFYALRGKDKIEFVGDPPIGCGDPDILSLPIEPGVHPRPW